MKIKNRNKQNSEVNPSLQEKTSPSSGKTAGASVLMIDNYDSFTYNLVHYLEELGAEVTVKRNDQLTLDEVAPFEFIVLSPGPGIPDEAGLLKPIISTYGPTKKIFGVCLGQQAIGEVYGGTLINLDTVYHGIATEINITGDDYIFEGIPNQIQVGRYHSWVVDANLPDSLEATSFDENGQIMSLKHETYDVRGVQFHPESVLTPHGKQMLKNWLKAPQPPKGELKGKTEFKN